MGRMGAPFGILEDQLSTSDILAGTGISVLVSGGQVTISATGAGGYWTRDVGNGYLYPSTLTDKVGIGQNTPLELLHVGNSSLSVPAIRLTNSSISWNIRVNGGAASQFEIQNVTGTLTPFRILSDAVDNSMYLRSAGLGFITTAPLDRLSFDSTCLVASNTRAMVNLSNTALNGTAANTAGTYIGANPTTGFLGSMFNFQVNGATMLRADYVAGPAVTMTTQILTVMNTNGQTMISDNNFGLFRIYSTGIGVSRTDTSGTFGFIQTGQVVTWAPNAANTATVAGLLVGGILNPGASNVGGTFYGARINPTVTGTTGLTAAYLLGVSASSVDVFTIGTTGTTTITGASSSVVLDNTARSATLALVTTSGELLSGVYLRSTTTGDYAGLRAPSTSTGGSLMTYYNSTDAVFRSAVEVSNRSGAGLFSSLLLMKSGGNVGINMTGAPAYPLDVNGSVRINTGGALRFWRPDGITEGFTINAGTANSFLSAPVGGFIFSAAVGGMSFDSNASHFFRNAAGSTVFVSIGTTGITSVLSDGSSLVIGGGTNVSTSVSLQAGRGFVGYNGGDVEVQGGTGKGVVISVNNANYGSGSRMAVASNTAIGFGMGGNITNTSTLAGAAMVALAGGDVAIGALTAGARLEVVKTTEQLRLSYDSSNYASFTVGSTGNATLGLTGAGQSWTMVGGSIQLGTLTNVASQIYLIRNNTVLGGFTSTNTLFSLFGGVTPANHLTINSSGFVGIGVGTATILSVLDIQQGTLGNAVQRIMSTATNDDPTETVYQNRVATTDATVTNIHTFAIPASTTYAIELTIIARRTGGASGTAEDGASYKVYGTYKNVAGTATIIGTLTKSPVNEDQAAWDVTLTPSTSNVIAQVTGAAANNVTWHMTARVYLVST